MEPRDFQLSVFNKPINEVLPALGGFARHVSLEDDGVTISRDLRQVEYDAGEVAPPIQYLTDVRATFRSAADLTRFPQVYRLIEVEQNQQFCLFDSYERDPHGANETYFIGPHCGARVIRFRHREYEGKPELSEMSVKMGRKVIRSVTAYRDEEDAQGKSRWKFAQYGAPQPWEDTSNYTRRQIKDRLNRDVLIDCMKEFGLDFGRVERGDFHRVVEFSEKVDGSTLEMYDNECKRLRRTLEDWEFELTGGRQYD